MVHSMEPKHSIMKGLHCRSTLLALSLFLALVNAQNQKDKDVHQDSEIRAPQVLVPFQLVNKFLTCLI